MLCDVGPLFLNDILFNLIFQLFIRTVIIRIS